MTEADRLLVHYRVGDPADTRRDPDALRRRAHAIALEQSIEMPISGVTDAGIRDRLVGRVHAVTPENAEVVLALHTDTFGHEPGQLMNMLFGNVSLQPDVRLLEIDAPARWLDGWRGPVHGIDGIRRACGADHDRPLTCSALKPQGLPPARLAALAAELAGAGIDLIKDDHGIADQTYAPFHERVPAVQAAIERVNAQRRDRQRTLYAPTVSGSPANQARQLKLLRDLGVGALLACPMLLGVAAFTDLAANAGIPVIAHPALGGASRIAPPLLLGRLFRLFGADASVFPNAGGRFSYDPDTCQAIAHALRAPWGRLNPALPVPAGGMTVARIPELIAAYGRDQMLLIGGNLLEAPGEVSERAGRFVAAVHRAGDIASGDG
ncbi:MAG: RuBisCO large subunit C-terminal-like domain-containing protein [Burkholderiaceae bacterium]